MTQQYETLQSYLNQAKRMIIKFGGKLAPQIIQDDDKIGEVATAIMCADWKYQEDYYGFENKPCLLSTLRCVYVKTALLKIYCKNLKNIPCHPLQDVETKFGKNLLDNVDNKEYISHLLNTRGVTQKQRDYITKYYFEGMNLQETGNYFGVTRQAVECVISTAFNTIRQYVQEFGE